MKKIFCFDLDGVVCRTPKNNNYKKSKPIPRAIKKINSLYDKGNYIKIFTARYMGRSKEKVNLAKKKGLILTKSQLKKWKLKHHKLIMGKPTYDIFVDDKAFGFNKNWTEKF